MATPEYFIAPFAVADAGDRVNTSIGVSLQIAVYLY
jgi:hypothetical protein